jgi:hypothetical protein
VAEHAVPEPAQAILAPYSGDERMIHRVGCDHRICVSQGLCICVGKLNRDWIRTDVLALD